MQQSLIYPDRVTDRERLIFFGLYPVSPESVKKIMDEATRKYKEDIEYTFRYKLVNQYIPWIFFFLFFVSLFIVVFLLSKSTNQMAITYGLPQVLLVNAFVAFLLLLIQKLIQRRFVVHWGEVVGANYIKYAFLVESYLIKGKPLEFIYIFTESDWSSYVLCYLAPSYNKESKVCIGVINKIEQKFISPQ